MTEKMSTTTPDIERENAEKLAELFPSVVIEVAGEDGIVHAAIDADALRELVGDVAEGQRERYQFTWPGKRQAKAEAYTPIDQTMRPEPGRSVGWDTTGNLYIKGDNLDALKLLRSTYAGKVKLIYIDPSYNTGHDLLYDDDFARTRADYDEEGGRLVENTTSNGRLHSDWRSMIYPRLLLLRDLLSSDGAIFSSIDDNESANLRKICDEVFGAGCFVASLPRVTKRSGKDHGTTVAKNHDYVYVYAKNINFLHLKGIGVDDGSYPLVDDYVNERSRDCGGNLGPRRDREEDHMHGQERRRLATGTLVKFDHSYADTIAELGYPTRSAPRAWWNEYKRTGEVPASRFATNPRHAAEMRRRAVEHYLEHGKSLARTTGALGYPKSREKLCEWVDELAPGRRRHRGPRPRREAISLERKVRAVAEPGARDGSAAEIAERHGVPGTAPYLWRREMMGDSGGEPERKGEPAGRGSDDPPDGAEVSRDMLREAKTQPGRARPGPDVRQATLEIARKDPGADPELPADAEKAATATAPGDKYKLCEILPAVGMAKSSHGCARGARPGGEAEGHAAAGRPWRGRPGPVAAPTATGASQRGPTQAASREGASASGPPTASWERRAWSRGWRGEGGATAPMGAGSPRRPLTCFATSGGGTTSGPTPPTRSG